MHNEETVPEAGQVTVSVKPKRYTTPDMVALSKFAALNESNQYEPSVESKSSAEKEDRKEDGKDKIMQKPMRR